MTVVKINAIEVPEGAGEELEARFAARAGAVEGRPGFQYFQLLRPTEGESRYFVVTWWEDEESFAAWMSSRDFARGHGGDGAGDDGDATHGDGDRAGGDRHGDEHGAPQEKPRPPVSTGATLMSFEVVEQTGPKGGD